MNTNNRTLNNILGTPEGANFPTVITNAETAASPIIISISALYVGIHADQELGELAERAVFITPGANEAIVVQSKGLNPLTQNDDGVSNAGFCGNSAWYFIPAVRALQLLAVESVEYHDYVIRTVKALEDKKKAVDGLTRNSASLKSEKAALEQQNGTLQAQLGQAIAAKKTLEQQLGQAATDRQALEQQVNNLNAQVAHLSRQVNDLLAEKASPIPGLRMPQSVPQQPAQAAAPIPGLNIPAPQQPAQQPAPAQPSDDLDDILKVLSQGSSAPQQPAQAAAPIPGLNIPAPQQPAQQPAPAQPAPAAMATDAVSANSFDLPM